LNYTKRAKRVDVKKLKDTLWKDIQQQQQEDKKEDVSFKKVLKDTTTELKHTNNEDITISYYFICLLHLCNEKEMELEEKEGKDLKLVVVSSCSSC
jgi:condensin complex subunit 2